MHLEMANSPGRSQRICVQLQCTTGTAADQARANNFNLSGHK